MENKNETINEMIEKDVEARKEIIEKNGKGGLKPFMEKYYPNVKPILGNYYGMDAALEISNGNIKSEQALRFYYISPLYKGEENMRYREMLYWGMTKLVGTKAKELENNQEIFEFDLFDDHYIAEIKTSIESLGQEEGFKISYDPNEILDASLTCNQNFIQKSNKKIPGSSIFNIHEENSDRELKINNAGMWIFTAEALSIIGMVSSDKFRKNYIEYSKTLEQATIVAKDAIESGTKIIAEAASNAKGFMVKCLDDVKNFITASAVFNTFSGLKYSDSYFINIITLLDNQANEIQDEIKKKKRSLKLEDDLDPYQELVIDQEIDRLIFERNQFMQYRNEIADQRSQALKDKREKINDKSYTTTDVLKEYIRINPNTSFTNVNMVNAMLKDKGILVKQGQWKLNPNNHWAARSAILGLFPDGNTQITIHWNELGKDLIMRLLAYEDGFRILLGGNGINISSNRIIDGDTSDDELLTILTYRDYKLRVNGKAV